MSRGPQIKYVRDDSGREIHGLCQEKISRNGETYYRFYSWYEDNGKRRKKYHGTSRDKIAATFAFRQWEASREKETITFGDPPQLLVDGQIVGPKPVEDSIDIADLQELLQSDQLFTIRQGNPVRIPAEWVWKKIGRLIMADPRLAAQKIGVPELARLQSLPAPAAPLLLKEIRDSYLNEKSFKYARQKSDAQSAWDQFAKAVGKLIIDDITTTDIARYYKTLTSQGYAPRTVKNRIRTMQGFLSHAVAIRKEHRPLLRELKQDIRTICRIPKQKEPSPEPMDKDDYLTLLESVKKDKTWYAILLTSLNLALHGTEMAEIEKSEINLKRSEFHTNRTKTGVVRVAKLWDRTVAAIRDYQKTDRFKKNQTKLLFTNKNNNPYTIQRVNEKLRRLRKKAGLPDIVVFDGIRDLFRRAAGATNFVATKWVMGHSLGIDDVYGFRDVDETVETMEKVEAYVFGRPDKQQEANSTHAPCGGGLLSGPSS